MNRIVGFVALTIIAIMASAHSGNASPPSLVLHSDSHMVQPGDTARVDIQLHHSDLAIAAVSGAGFRFRYDASVFRLESQEATSALGLDTLMIVRHDSDAGFFAASIVQKNGTGIRGIHPLMRLTLIAIGSDGVTHSAFNLSETELLLTDGGLISTDSSQTDMVLAPNVVWPGDADRDGRVTEADILAIGLAWGLSGPPRNDTIIRFAPIPADSWDHAAAVHADTDGNGRVDEQDIRAVRMLFMPPDPLSSSLSEIFLPVASAGEDFSLELHFDEAMMGASMSLAIPPIPIDVSPPDFENWTTDIGVIPFLAIHEQTGTVTVAVSKFRDSDPLPVSATIVRFTITLLETIDIPAPIRLMRTAMSSESGVHHSPDFELVIRKLTDIEPTETAHMATRIELLPAFPNPFNPATHIRYRISEPNTIRLSVLDVMGREVAVLVDAAHQPGTYSARFDASGLATGIYMCLLKTESDMRIQKITLIK
jgi:hypothetical protein